MVGAKLGHSCDEKLYIMLTITFAEYFYPINQSVNRNSLFLRFQNMVNKPGEAVGNIEFYRPLKHNDDDEITNGRNNAKFTKQYQLLR